MDNEPRPPQRSRPRLSLLLRLGAISLLAGAFVGVVGGVCSRLAMRAVAIAGGVPPVLTGEGTLLVLIVGVLHGVTAAILFLAMRAHLRGAGATQGLAFGLVVLLAFGPAFFIADQAGELGVSAPVGVVLFSLLFVIGAALVGWSVQSVERRLISGDGVVLRVLGVAGLLIALGSVPYVIGVYLLAAVRLVQLPAR